MVKNRQKKYPNNLVEQHYRLMKRFVKQGMGIFSFDTASRASQEYEAMTIIMPRPKEHPGSRPRWVGSPAGSDFPAALLRFGACLGIEIEACAAHHPQQKSCSLCAKGVHFVRKVFSSCPGITLLHSVCL